MVLTSFAHIGFIFIKTSWFVSINSKWFSSPKKKLEQAVQKEVDFEALWNLK
jgi:hypothetical protein